GARGHVTALMCLVGALVRGETHVAVRAEDLGRPELLLQGVQQRDHRAADTDLVALPVGVPEPGAVVQLELGIEVGRVVRDTGEGHGRQRMPGDWLKLIGSPGPVAGRIRVMSRTWRAVTPVDIPAVVAFTNLVGERDGTGEIITEQATAEMFQA